MSTTPAAPPSKLPNLYQLHGHGLHVTYSLSGIDGKPHFTYQDAHQTLQFQGPDIRSVSTDIGTLVTVTIRMTIDTGSTTFSLMVPGVNLEFSSQAQIKTFGVTTIHKFSVVPAFRQGQTQLYSLTELSGTAAAVKF
ncbi:MAG TPA: hypothetical protein VG649_17090 [Candidatus Angelobacter sp.]|jgi:hypothetical protein|nr:hypothetical protein [Candidatus Angelobacter sp.]